MENNYEFASPNDDVKDGYDIYTQHKVKEAKGIFSRYNLGLFIYLLVSYASVFLLELILILIVGVEKYYDLVNNNVYLQWGFSVLSMYVISFPVFFIFTKGMKKRTYKKSKLSPADFLLYFIISWGAMIVGSIIGNVLNVIISAILGREVSNTTSDLIEKSPLWLIILVVVIIGPIIEEFLFRKMMIDRLGCYGDKTAIIVSSVAFGLFHGNFYQFFYATLLGFILGYMYTKTGKNLYNTLLHMIVNFFGSVAAIPILKISARIEELTQSLQNGAQEGYKELINSIMIVSSYSVVQYGVALAGIIVMIMYMTKNVIKINKYCEYAIPREKTFSTVVLNVGTILFATLSLVVFALNIFIA